MAARTLLRRLPSPVGFLLVAASFVLPFAIVTVGDAQLPDGYRVTYTAVDLATGHVGSISAGSGPRAAVFSLGWAFARTVPAQPFLIAAMALTALGVLASLIPGAWSRALSRGAAAVLALIFLTGGQVNAATAAARQARKDAEPIFGDGQGAGVLTSTHIGYGFWLAVGLLGALTIVAAVELVVHSRQKPVRAG